jgi:hypothetical protein
LPAGLQDTIRDGVKGGPVKVMRKTVNWSVYLMTGAVGLLAVHLFSSSPPWLSLLPSGFYMAVAISGYMAYGERSWGRQASEASDAALCCRGELAGGAAPGSTGGRVAARSAQAMTSLATSWTVL